MDSLYPPSDPSSAIDDIIRIAKAQEQLWSSAHGWAPDTAADLLEKARLDRQVSFACTLRDYLAAFPADSAEARQILGYTTLRSLCEGALKLFFSAYFEDYKDDPDAIRRKNAALVSPEEVQFDKLISLYEDRGRASFVPFLRRVQSRGNAIHHFSDRDTGTQSELLADIVEFRDFLLAVDMQLPSDPPEEYGE